MEDRDRGENVEESFPLARRDGDEHFRIVPAPDYNMAGSSSNPIRAALGRTNGALTEEAVGNMLSNILNGSNQPVRIAEGGDMQIDLTQLASVWREDRSEAQLRPRININDDMEQPRPQQPPPPNRAVNNKAEIKKIETMVDMFAKVIKHKMMEGLKKGKYGWDKNMDFSAEASIVKSILDNAEANQDYEPSPYPETSRNINSAAAYMFIAWYSIVGNSLNQMFDEGYF